MLERIGVLTEIDGTALAIYCQAYGTWVEAAERIKTTGMIVKSPSGYPIQNPYLAIANKAVDQMKSLLAEFGMTPSSRSRIVVPKKKQPPPARNSAARLMEGWYDDK